MNEPERADRGAAAAAMPASRLADEGEFPTLGGATGWLNSSPLTSAGLRGKVVLVDFWTYTCINWLRTLPYLRTWAREYGPRGLVVIGVHTPEFGFEADVGNVLLAAKSLGVEYPIALDSKRAVWRAFHNDYWPALYLVDSHGRIRHHQFGEGGYETAELAIRRLLAERAPASALPAALPVDGAGREAAADWRNLRSPETYVGYDRAERFASPGGAVPGRPHAYGYPTRLPLNDWALAGEWIVGAEGARLAQPNGAITFEFHARDVHLVMGPAARGGVIRFRVRVDGKPPGAAHGADVDEQGNGTANQQRLFQLIRQQAPFGDRRFEIEFLDSGLEAFSFTFG